MSAETTRTLTIEKQMPFPPEKIWRALTEGALMKQWLMENDFQPVVGHRFDFRSTPVANWDGIINCQVTVVEPGKKISYTWSSMGLNSVVAWTLTAAGGGTLVRMDHSGFRPDQTAAYNGANYGWQKFITALEGVLSGLN